MTQAHDITGSAALSKDRFDRILDAAITEIAEERIPSS